MTVRPYTPEYLRSRLSTLLADQLGQYQNPGKPTTYSTSISVGDPKPGTQIEIEALEVIIPREPLQESFPTGDGYFLTERWAITLRQYDLEKSTMDAVYVILQNFPGAVLQPKTQVILPTGNIVDERVVVLKQSNLVNGV